MCICSKNHFKDLQFFSRKLIKNEPNNLQPSTDPSPHNLSLFAHILSLPCSHCFASSFNPPPYIYYQTLWTPELCLSYSLELVPSATGGFILNRRVCWRLRWVCESQCVRTRTWLVCRGVDVNIAWYFSLTHRCHPSSVVAVSGLLLGNLIILSTYVNIITVLFGLLCLLF